MSPAEADPIAEWRPPWDHPPLVADYSLDRPLLKRLTEAVVQRQASVAESRTHAVFLRGGVLVGEHLLPEDDIRQDLVLKWRKVKEASIGVELDGLLERGFKKPSPCTVGLCPC